MPALINLSQNSRLVRALFGLLILLYLAGSLQLDSLHQLFHQHDDSIAHTAELEENACHRTVFHQATQNTCDHPTHLSEFKKCPWCFGFIHGEKAYTETSFKSEFNFFKPFFGYSTPEKIRTIVISFGSRGPPAEFS